MAWTLAIASICWAIATTIIVVFFGRVANLNEIRSETKTSYNDDQWEAERYQPWKDVAHVFKQCASHD